jgi:hypothetical protein
LKRIGSKGMEVEVEVEGDEVEEEKGGQQDKA